MLSEYLGTLLQAGTNAPGSGLPNFVSRGGAVAARLAHNQEVAGSSPAPATNSHAAPCEPDRCVFRGDEKPGTNFDAPAYAAQSSEKSRLRLLAVLSAPKGEGGPFSYIAPQKRPVANVGFLSNCVVMEYQNV